MPRTVRMDPSWKRTIAARRPGFGGCAGIRVLPLAKPFGAGDFEKLRKDDPRVGRRGNGPVTLVGAG